MINHTTYINTAYDQQVTTMRTLMDTAFAIKFFGTFFAIMNPFLTLPFFMSMTADNTSKEQRYMACYIAFYSFIICIASAIIGTQILSFFEIKIAHFRVAGGLVLLGIAFSMVNGSKTEGHDEDSKKQPTVKRLSRDDIFYPMIFPMTIGPATLFVDLNLLINNPSDRLWQVNNSNRLWAYVIIA